MESVVRAHNSEWLLYLWYKTTAWVEQADRNGTGGASFGAGPYNAFAASIASAWCKEARAARVVGGKQCQFLLNMTGKGRGYQIWQAGRFFLFLCLLWV